MAKMPFEIRTGLISAEISKTTPKALQRMNFLLRGKLSSKTTRFVIVIHLFTLLFGYSPLPAKPLFLLK
jgi:hypothetical protein